MYKLKILVIGPCNSGKTSIANFLTSATESFSGDYHPTQGVRILEFDAQNLNVNNKVVKAEVELWDCSGDHKFESCWPAMQRGAHGVVFVYNPTSLDQARQLELFYNYFVTQPRLNPRNCMVFVHSKMHPTGERDQGRPTKLSNTFQRVVQVAANVEESGNRLRGDFNNFLITLLGGLRDSREQEELQIINAEYGGY